MALHILFFLVALLPAAHAQEVHQELRGTWRAEAVEIIREEDRLVPGTGTKSHYQTLRAMLLDGDRKGTYITIENDFLDLEVGDKFFVNYLITVDGKELYTVEEPDRRWAIFVLIIFFVTVVLIFGGYQGLRSLISLAGSLVIIFYILLPNVLLHAPVLVSSITAALVLGLAIFFTHGLNRKSLAAYMGCITTILFTIGMAHVAVDATNLTGFVGDASTYLNIDTEGKLNLGGIFLAAVIIGVLGILDDVAITQAAAVEQLIRANPNLSRREVYTRAMQIGQEHVGALINTLALAYAGASLPLLLLFYNSDAPILLSINREIFSAEIVRTIVGSIGIILTVPISTLLAVWLLVPGKQ